MDYLRQQLSGRVDDSTSNHNNVPIGRAVTIHPGQVEEAVHIIDYQGAIDLSRLHFSVGDESVQADGQHGIDTFLDIAVFQVSSHCSSKSCDLSEYGIGKLEHFNDASYLSLCNNDGRLQIDRERFRGHHTELLVPSLGPMPQDHIIDGGEILVSERDRTYEVMIANCNKQGKQVFMAGQVIFQSFGRHSSDDLDPAVGMHLLMIGVAICLFFSICNLRIHMGTRAQYNGPRLLPLFRDGAISHEQYRVVRRHEDHGQQLTAEGQEEEASDDGLNDTEEQEPQEPSEPRDPSQQLELVHVL
jgi:hypothetical protein